jgi:nickel transport protein
MTTESTHREMSLLSRLLSGLVIGFGLIFTFPCTVWAHNVFIYAWVDGDTVYTESYFGAKRKVQGGLIRVFDLPGKELLEGRTNKKGEFSFKTPQQTDLRIVIEAGMGHRNEFILKVEDTSDVGDVAEPVKTDGTKAESTNSISADAEQIKAVVEQVLDSRLRPLRQELAAIRKEKSVGVTEIIGGIGYIFGIMGLIMYFKSRKTRG